MASVSIPKGNAERLAWCANFKQEFPDLAESFDYSHDAQNDLMNRVDALRYCTERAQKALAFSKACSKYKYAMLNGVKDTQEPPVAPVFNDVPAPSAAFEAGLLASISNDLQKMKLHKNYSAAIAQTLQIAPTESASLNLTDAKPTGKGFALADSIARIEWFKGTFDGVVIDSQRGAETTWTRLDRDFRSPFDDTRPPLTAGQPEERRYRLRYFIDDELVGEWSETITVWTKP